MNIILTGVTGTLGSQILVELLKNKKIERFYLLIRNKKSTPAEIRFKKILSSPIFRESQINTEKIIILNPEDFCNPKNYLNKEDQNYFIHSAGFVNLTTDIEQRDSIFNENFHFTKKLYNTFRNFIKKFSYISTSFSIGDIGGLIQNNYHNGITTNYRNSYEESKHKTEEYLLNKTKSNDNIKIQILRPSVIGGNIESEPRNYISKFMVYYFIGKFFFKNPLLKNKMRLSINTKAGLNIIPVDYVAKVISKVIFRDDIQQLNIVHKKCTDLESGLTRIIDTVGYKKFSFVDNIKSSDLRGKNDLENFYYSSIGNHLSAYTLSKPYEYNTALLESILPMPEYNLEDYLVDTIKYAMSKNFRNENW